MILMFSITHNGKKFVYANSKKGFTAYKSKPRGEELVLDSDGRVVSTNISDFWEGL